jgi:hypothetical protein
MIDTVFSVSMANCILRIDWDRHEIIITEEEDDDDGRRLQMTSVNIL